jgi:hypothetical protein
MVGQGGKPRSAGVARGSLRSRRTARVAIFSDALAQVRRQLWAQEEATFCGSAQEVDTVKVPRVFMERLTDAVCYAA